MAIQVNVSAGRTSQPYPVGIGNIVTLTPQAVGGGTGYVEYSQSPMTDITNGLAVWVRWPKGSVNVTTSDTSEYVMFIRFVCTAGNIAFTVGDVTGSRSNPLMPWISNQATYVFDANGNYIGLSGPGGVTSSAIPTYTWANRPTGTAAVTGNIARFSDVGGGSPSTGGGNFFFYNGTRWKPMAGSICLDAVDTANAAVANTTEQNLNPNHVLIPAGVIGDYDRLRLWVSLSKNAASDSSTIRVRFGPLGTTADPILATVTTLATTNQSLGFIMEFKRNSATTIQKQGNASTDVSFNGASAGTYPAAVTVSDMNANGMYMSITSQMTGGTEVVTLQDFVLELCTTDSQ